MNIFEQLSSLIDEEVLKDRTSDLIDSLPLDKHTFLDPRKDPRFIYIQRDDSGYGEIIFKPLPFPDRIDKRDFLLTIDFKKHDKFIGSERINENCPKTIGKECAICDHLPNIPQQLKHIIQGIVINNSGETQYRGEIKLYEMTRKLLSIVASNDDAFMKLFDPNSNIFLKIVIRKDDNGYFTYDESHLFEDDSINIQTILKPNEEFYYKDLKDTLYNPNNFMSYERMIRKYVKHLEHIDFSEKDKYETPRNEIVDPVVSDDEIVDFMDDLIEDIIQKDDEQEKNDKTDTIVEELLTEEKVEENQDNKKENKNDNKKEIVKENFDIEEVINNEDFFDDI